MNICMQWNIRKKFNSKDYLNRIHKIEFGSLIMDHLPVISAQIRECAVSDEENRLMNRRCVWRSFNWYLDGKYGT